MKKLLLFLTVLATFSSCGKAYYNPIENYILQGKNERWVFNAGTFGLDLHRPYNTPYWQRCEKIGNATNGIIFIDGINFTYEVNKDTVKLYGQNDNQTLITYILVYDKSQQNFKGIFQK